MPFFEKYAEYKGAARAALFVIGLLFVFLLTMQSWSEISGLLEDIKPGEFVFSIVIAVLGNVAMAIFFSRLLGKYGVRISGLLAFKMFMVGQIAKYIPGKIWAVAYQVSHVAGVSGAKGVVLANLEIMLGAMFVTSVVTVVLLCLLVSKFTAFALFILGMTGFVLLYRANVVNQVLRLMQGRFKVVRFLAEAESEPTSLVGGIVFFLVFCSTYVFSYVLMLDAVFGFSFEESLVYIALLSAAWIGGVFAFLVPAGMGVREVLFIAASSYMVPQHSVEMLASIAILSRIWQIIQELIGVFLLIFLRR